MNLLFKKTKATYQVGAIRQSRFQNCRAGFTLIEFLIVSGVMMFLLAMAAPFSTSIRSEISMKKTLRQVKTDIITTMGYSLAGKSIAALSEGDLMNTSLVPSHYALYFATDTDYGDQKPYKYLEMTTEIITSSEQETKLVYQKEKEIPSSAIYLKSIRLKKNESDPGLAVNSAFMLFVPPFGKVVFFTGHNSLLTDASYEFNSLSSIKNASDYRFIELDFQYKDEEQTLTTLSFGVDKMINIL